MNAPVEMTWPEPEESTVYVVDDDRTLLRGMGRFLGAEGYRVQAFDDPIRAREAIEANPPHLLLTDKDLPGMDGIELARAALEADPDVAILMLTGGADAQSAADALRLGLMDYLFKPLELETIAGKVQQALVQRAQAIYARELEAWRRAEVETRTREAEERAEELESVTLAALSSLVKLLEAKSDHFKGHSQAVAAVAAGMARELELSHKDIREIRIAGLLHDIGMISVPDRVIEKTDTLEPSEYEQVKEHVALAQEILSPFPHLGNVVQYVCGHHERFDGSGYPDGLREDQISLGAQIVGAADVFQALVESRAFRDAKLPDEALETLRGVEGVWFSKRILDTLERVARSAPT